MIDSNIIISFICSIVGVIVGMIFNKYIERKLNYDIKHDEIILDNEIITLKDKLTIYWSIYFKLLICQSANMQITKINNLNNIIQLENETIIKNLDEIVDIISNNIQNMNIDENMIDLILQFITHVLAYKYLKQSSIQNKTPSEYGYPFPDQFTQEITSRTFKYQLIFDKYIGNNTDQINSNTNSNLNVKDKIKKIYDQIPQNIIRSLSENSIQFDEDDLDIICDPADINLLEIFDNNNNNKRKDLIIKIN